MDFIFCFLGFHFFVCLNIFLSNQTYPNWIINLNLQDKRLIKIYLASCYSLIETLTTVGYGDVVCQCFAERVLQIIILAVGVIAYSYLISAFGNLIKNESQSSIKYNNNMKILEEIRIDYPNMTYKLYNKIYHYIESKTHSEKKIDSTALVNSLPFNLKNTILLVMYRNIIKNFKIFKKRENPNFIIEILSKFVPSTNKKQDFILFEGEMIEEIVFVKDGRLSLEAAIDMDDQEGSINKYFHQNFLGITSAKEMKKNEENNNTNNSRMIRYTKIKDFDNAKFILNNAVKKQVNYLFNDISEEPSIFDKTKTKLERKKSMDVIDKATRIDILNHEPVKNEEGNYKYIKVIDIRKNENFGGLYMFLRRPSPLSLQVRSKIAELYLLPKKDIFAISKVYRNIWGKIYKKDFHNMISIKRQTFKILNKYTEMNGFGLINPVEKSRFIHLEDNLNFNDKFKKSDKSLLTENVSHKNLIMTPEYNKNLLSKRGVSTSKFKINNNISSKNHNFKELNKILKESLQSEANSSQIAKTERDKFSELFETKNLKPQNNILDIKKSKNGTYVLGVKKSKNNTNKSDIKKSKNKTNVFGIKYRKNISNILDIKTSKNNIYLINKKTSQKTPSKNNLRGNNSIINIHRQNTLNQNNPIQISPSKKQIKINVQRASQNELKSEKNYEQITQKTERISQEPLNQLFIKNKADEIKEEMKKSKKKEKRKKIFSLGKKTAKLFEDKNFTIIFGNNTNNYFRRHK